MSNNNDVVEPSEAESEGEPTGEETALVGSEQQEECAEDIPDEEIFPFDPELLDDASPGVKKAIIQMTSASMRMGGPIADPLARAIARVIDSTHVSALIESMDRNAKEELADTQHARWVYLVYVAVAMLFAGFVLWLLSDSNPELLKDLIAILAGFAGGLGAGFGIGTRRRRR